MNEQIKFIEIRDSGTMIPAMAIALDGADHPLLRAAGYGAGRRYVFLCKLTGGAAAGNYDPYEWPANPRTMREAHIVIERDWDTLSSGDVVDVQFALGETAAKKTSEVTVGVPGDMLEEVWDRR